MTFIGIVLKDMIPHDMGDFAVVGDLNRCVYARYAMRASDVQHSVPVSLNLWGQWTDWETRWTAYIRTCSGGVTRTTRQCVSVCVGKTPVVNCHGDAEEMTPRNTQRCDIRLPNNYIYYDRYWSTNKRRSVTDDWLNFLYPLDAVQGCVPFNLAVVGDFTVVTLSNR